MVVGMAKGHRDRHGRWVRVGAVAEITVSESYPIQIDEGERFRIAEVDDDGGVVRRCLDMYLRHAPGEFKIVSPPTKAEAREIARMGTRHGAVATRRDLPKGRRNMNSEDRHGWLVEWDGGWRTVDSPKAAETFIAGKIAESGHAERAEFSIVRDEPAEQRVEVWPRGDRIAVSRDGLPVGEVTKVGDTFSTRVFCVPAPFDWFGGVHESIEAAVDFVVEEGETPDHIKEGGEDR